MKSLWRYGLFLVLLLLAGCFQQAGDSMQLSNSTLEPLEPASPAADNPLIESPTEEPAEPISVASPTIRPASSGPVTATFPPITIIVQPTNAPDPTETASTDAAVSGQSSAELTATTIQFITPGIPLGPNLDTSTPSGGALTATPSGLITPTALNNPDDETTSINVSVDPACTYTVQRGDTVYRIALAHDTSVAAMREVNPELEGENPIIQPGQVLVLPDCDGTATDLIEAATPSPTRVESVIEPAFPATTATTASGSPETYVVQPGDTLFIIAQRYGTTVNALVQANNLSNPNRLSVGQELIIPPQP